MKTTQHADALPALVKTSSWYKDPSVIAAVAAPFAAVGADAGAKAIGNLFAAKQKSRAFKTMMQENPHLKPRDATNTQRYFNTLWTTNREMAKDPIVAGSFVYNQHGQSDEGHPHRGILEGAAGMARMRADMLKGAPPPGMVGRRVESTLQNFVGAVQAGKQQRLDERDAQFNQIVQESIDDSKRLEEIRKNIIQQGRDRGLHGELPEELGRPVFQQMRMKRSSPTNLRALLGI